MKLVFLPGVGGAPDFWQPVGALLPAGWTKAYLGWPGLGDQPADPTVRGFDDLVRLAEAELDEPVALIAQSMGGIVAVRLALRHPDRVERLVLAVTSGGVDVAGLGAVDWRIEYRRNFPNAASWVFDGWGDHTADLPRLTAPTLLLWGDRDPISPVAVGEHLASLLPNARLCVLPGGTHALSTEQAPAVAALIRAHLAQT
jgi:pimeloyl-ACP methyl ester carboxylesterase